MFSLRKCIKRNATIIAAILGMAATIGVTAWQLYDNKMTTIAQSIVKARPIINGAYEPYNSTQILLSPYKVDSSKLNNKSLPYIKNTSQNDAENIQIRLIYKDNVKSKQYLSYYIRLASIASHQKIFINNTIKPDYRLYAIETQYSSTQGEVIRTNMDSHSMAGDYGFMTANNNIPWNTETTIYDNNKIINRIKKFDESGAIIYRTSRNSFNKSGRILFIYNN